MQTHDTDLFGHLGRGQLRVRRTRLDLPGSGVEKAAPGPSSSVGSGWWVAGDVLGAVVVAEELVAVRAGPQVGPGVQDGVRPPDRVGFEAVMPPAKGCEVVRGRLAALGVGDDVVGVATPCGSGAPREDAPAVAEGGLFGQP